MTSHSTPEAASAGSAPADGALCAATAEHARNAAAALAEPACASEAASAGMVAATAEHAAAASAEPGRPKRPRPTDLSSVIVHVLVCHRHVQAMRKRRAIFEHSQSLQTCLTLNSGLLDELVKAGAAVAVPPLVLTVFQALQEVTDQLHIYGDADVSRWVDAYILQSFWSASHSKARYKRRRTSRELAAEAEDSGPAGETEAEGTTAEADEAALEPSPAGAGAAAAAEPLDPPAATAEAAVHVAAAGPAANQADLEPSPAGDSAAAAAEEPRMTAADDHALCDPAQCPFHPDNETESEIEQAAEAEQAPAADTSPTSEEGRAEAAAAEDGDDQAETSPTSEEGRAEAAAAEDGDDDAEILPTEAAAAERDGEDLEMSRELERALRASPLNPSMQHAAHAVAKKPAAAAATLEETSDESRRPEVSASAVAAAGPTPCPPSASAAAAAGPTPCPPHAHKLAGWNSFLASFSAPDMTFPEKRAAAAWQWKAMTAEQKNTFAEAAKTQQKPVREKPGCSKCRFQGCAQCRA